MTVKQDKIVANVIGSQITSNDIVRTLGKYCEKGDFFLENSISYD